jgi:hypothetical protein
MHRSVRASAITVAVCLFLSHPAFGQLTRAGDATPVLFTVNDATIAYDPVHDVYAVVGTTDEVVRAVFVDASGLLLGGLQRFGYSWSAHNTFWTWAPSVTYSADVTNTDGTRGDFMLAWGQPLTSSHLVTQSFRYALAAPFSSSRIHELFASFASSTLGYSSTSQVFLVALPGSYVRRTDTPDGEAVPAVLLRLDAGVIGDWFPLAGASGPAYELGMRWDTGIAWNRDANEFGVAYAWSGASTGGATFVRVGADGSVRRRTVLHTSAATAAIDVAFNPATGRYLAVWFDGAVRAAEISSGGDVLSTGIISSNTADALSLAYNEVSATFLLAVHGPATGLWAAELNRRGARSSPDIYLSHPSTSYREDSQWLPTAKFDVDIAASTRRAEWNVAFTNTTGDREWYSTQAGVFRFFLNTKIHTQIVRTSSADGGAPGSLDPIVACSTPDPFASLGGGTCYNGGWLPPGMSPPATDPSPPPATSTTTCTTPDPFASIGGGTCVNGGWLPPGMAAPSSTPGGCSTPDPFANIPGMYGVCINGGWVPRLR